MRVLPAFLVAAVLGHLQRCTVPRDRLDAGVIVRHPEHRDGGGGRESRAEENEDLHRLVGQKCPLGLLVHT